MRREIDSHGEQDLNSSSRAPTIVGIILGLALVATIGIVLNRGPSTRIMSSGSVSSLTPVSELETITAKMGQHWDHAPQVPPPTRRDKQAKVVVSWTASEFSGDLDAQKGVRYSYWGFEGQVPGPILRVRVGDLVEVHLTNDASSAHAHNIDFHFATGPGGGASALDVAPGETAVVQVRALAPGIYMYHCATPDIPTHIGNGMYGYVIVEPEGGLPDVDHEFYVVQSEFYASGGSPASLDLSRLDNEEPTHVVFNGSIGSLLGENSPKVKSGDAVRIWFGNAGPQLTSSFHVIGEIFDRVYREGDLISPPARGIQTTTVPAGGGVVVDLKFDIPGTYLLVDHAIARTLHKGALGAIVVVGPENREIFSAKSRSKGDGGHGTGQATPAAGVGVAITKGAWDQKNASRAYEPIRIEVKAGATVTWTNQDDQIHTVTADDGSFDSGFLKAGAAWSHTFTKPGTFTYKCLPHPWMKGTVVVT